MQTYLSCGAPKRGGVFLMAPPPASRSVFGPWLKGRRAMLGWSQAVLAERAGTTPATVQRLENGLRNPSRALVKRLAGALGAGEEEALIVAGFAAEADAARAAGVQRIELPGDYALQAPVGDPDAALVTAIVEAALRAIKAGDVRPMPEFTEEQWRAIDAGIRDDQEDERRGD